ncbi:MAG TPA: FecR domain-containing protein [Fluviicoccus sp.]|nr:FecR domain-containing protein [Fluviicoccus sp.]
MNIGKGVMAMLLLTVSLTGWAGQKAGVVTQLEGEVSVLDSLGGAHELRLGSPVSEGDTLVTGKTGQVHLRMEDDGYLAVRGNTRLVIDTYRAANKDDSRSVLKLLRGSFRSVTGWIGQLNPANYQVRTPTASIGIRGTDHEPVFIPEEEATPDAPAGTYDRVNEGGTVLESQGERVDVEPGRAAFAPFRDRPRLLLSLPRFLENHPLMDEKLEALKPELKAKVLERIEMIRGLKRDLLERRLKRRHRH